MLRISVLNEPGIVRMKLEGKLAHEWVEEARTAWATVGKINGSIGLIVDLLGVSFVDGAGPDLLIQMRRCGAELIGSGPLMSAVIEEIEDAAGVAAQNEVNRE